MTVTEARTAIQDVVEAHTTHNTFYSIWQDAKERPSEPTFPCVIWEQWRARLFEDEQGYLKRAILVRLLIVDSVSTQRTSAQRDTAIEAAENVAADIVLRLRRDPYEWVISNISTTTVYDEKYQLDTGVVLTFTVETDAICLGDSFNPPAECATFEELIAPLTWPEILAEMSVEQIAAAQADLGGASCPMTVVINVDGSEEERLTGIDPCEDQTYNITITYS